MQGSQTSTQYKFFFYLLAVFFIISLNYYLSSILFRGNNFYDIKRILELFLLCITASYLLLCEQQWSAWLSVYQALPKLTKSALWMILILGIISSIFTPVPKFAFLEVATYVLLFFFAIFFAAQRLLIGKELDQRLMAILIMANVAYIISFFYVYIDFLIYPNPNSNYVHNAFPGFMNLRFFSQYQIWTLPLISLPIFLYPDNRLLKYFTYVLTSLWWAIAFIHGTKSVAVAIILALIYSAIIFKQTFWLWCRRHSWIFLGSLITYWAFLYLFPYLAALMHTHSFSNLTLGASNIITPLQAAITPLHDSSLERIALLNSAKDLIWQHPFLGVGPMHFAYYGVHFAAHPHNALVQIMVEWGLPVGCIVFALLIWGITKWTRRNKIFQAPSMLQLSLTISFVSGCIDALMDGVIVTPLSQIMFSICIGWMLSCYFQSARLIEKNPLSQTIIGGGLIVFSIFAVVLGVYPEILNLPQKEIGYILQQQNQVFRPRFWLQGWLQGW